MSTLGRLLAVLALLGVLAGCSDSGDGVEAGGASTTAATETTVDSSTTDGVATTGGSASTDTAPPTTVEQRGAMGLYPERVYVPNTRSDTVQVIDPVSCEVVDRYAVGHVPHHITATWDLSELLVFNTESNSFTAIDPATGKPDRTIPVDDPYNLYFLPDGSEAIVVAERFQRLDFRDPDTWELNWSVEIGPPGVDHLAFSRDADYLLTSTEFSGSVVKVDIPGRQVAGILEVGGAPIDVVRDPDDDRIFYVANQELHGVHVIDGDSLTELAFVPTGKGAHGLLLSKDKSKIYVSNRLEGSISVLDRATRTVEAKWDTGGSPDMGLLDPSGATMWIANRYHSSVFAIDVATGTVRCTIPTDAGPHGLTYFPTPGVHAIGHNGLMIDEDGNIE